MSLDMYPQAVIDLILESRRGPDEGGLVHLMRDDYTALCGAELTGDIVAEDCPIDCAMCAYEHGE